MAIYMEWAAGKIKGGVTDEGHKDWILIDSLQFGVGRGISTQVGVATKRESSTVSVSEITITKQTDRSSTPLFQEACVGVTGVPVKLHIVRTGDTSMTPFLEYEGKKV
jgi:type VI secretion system secreted protein Hcp